MRWILVAAMAATGCVAAGEQPAADGPPVDEPTMTDAGQPDSSNRELPQACAEAGLWRVDVTCWHDIEASRSIYIDVSGGAVIAPLVVDLGTRAWTTPSAVSGSASVSSAGACRIDLSWRDAATGNYAVTVYPRPGNAISGGGGAGTDVCEVTAYRQSCLISGPLVVICHGSS